MRILKKNYTYLLLAGAAFLLTSFIDPVYSCREIIEKMNSSVGEIKGLKYNLKLVERGDKKYNFFSSSVKLSRIPRKLYINAGGIEILWVQGTHNGDALVNTHGFPYINLHLDPYGSLMRQGQHHTINELGFDYMNNVIREFVKSAGDKFDHYFIPNGEETINGRACYKIIITNNDFKYLDYTVKKDENLLTIARKLFVSEYMVLSVNKPKVDDYKDVKEGQVIKVPSTYAKYVLVYVDKLNFLPIGIRIFDDKGLYEQYDYFNLLLNPVFEQEEFNKDYKEYGF